MDKNNEWEKVWADHMIDVRGSITKFAPKELWKPIAEIVESQKPFIHQLIEKEYWKGYEVGRENLKIINEDVATACKELIKDIRKWLNNYWIQPHGDLSRCPHCFKEDILDKLVTLEKESTLEEE